MAANNIDIEKGQAISTTIGAKSSWDSSAAEATSNVRSHTPLELFQLLVGIHTHPPLTHDRPDASSSTGRDSSAARPRSENIGLYQRAKNEERQMRISYMLTGFISNTLYMLQIVLAATFTGLSAYKDSSPVTLTVLGAINTVLAGCLAWQKGQGVPQRYRKARDEYQALILEIEMAERSFIGGANDVKADPWAEKVRLQKLFDVARANQQANYPDLYVSTAAHSAVVKSESEKSTT